MGLFSTTHIHQSGRTEYVPYEKLVTVTENRAPTDESVRLLKEFEQKAKDKIIETIHINNNVIEACAIFYVNDVCQWKIEYSLRFKLNGKDYKLKGYLEDEDVVRTSPREYRLQQLKQILIKKYSEVIAEELLKQSNFFDPKDIK